VTAPPKNVSEDVKPLTVGELVQLLQKFDSSQPVQLEGCDCYGWAKGVEELGDLPSYRMQGNWVVVTRHDWSDSW